MGDRCSVQFKQGDELSPVLCMHWGGKGFANDAMNYLKKLKKESGNSQVEPLERLEPCIVMVDFIRELTKDHDRVKSGIYLGKTTRDIDNSDNGNYIIDVDTLKVQHEKGEFE